LTTIIQEILGDIEGGAQLSAALERRGEVFAESYTGLVKAGEASGKLSEVLSRLAATMEKERQFRAKVKGALVYPAAIVIVMIGVFVIIMVYVVPQMLQTFLTFDAELPWSTLLLIKISDTLTNQGIYVLIAVIAMIFAIRYYYRTPGGRYIMDAMFLKVPIFGAIIKQSTIVQFTRTISLLIDSGVPIVDSLKIAKNTVNNVLYKDAVERFIEDVKHGYPLSQSIAKEAIIPPFVSQMVVVGEETGTVSVRMDSIADYYEGEVDKIVKNMSTLIEPIIMVFLGAGVLFLIMAVILPIYKLTSDFH
jgi:type IV pilus assembly protein PilC